MVKEKDSHVVLVLEHDVSDWKATEKRLKNHNITDYYEFDPQLDDLEGCKKWVKSADLNKYSIVFLDVFFWSEWDKIHEQSSKDEAYDLLRIIRERAPWLPVVAYTQHIDHGRLTYEMSRRHFDAIIPKKLIKSDSSFCLDLFDDIVKQATVTRQRLACVFDYLPLSTKTSPRSVPRRVPIELELDGDATSFLCEAIGEKRTQELLGTMFPLHRRLILREMKAGYSGNCTFRVEALGQQERFGRESYWFLKIGYDASELTEEVRAYREVQASGLHHGYYPPLLHAGVFVEPPLAAICYQLEPHCVTLLDFLLNSSTDSYNQLENIFDKLFSILFEISGHTPRENGLVNKHWFSINDIQNIVTRISNEVDVPVILQNDDVLGKLTDLPTKYKRGLIHGDLNASNILISSKDGFVYLIDFAHAKMAPIVLDAAKLEMDILLSFPLEQFSDETSSRALIEEKWQLGANLADSPLDIICRLIRTGITKKNSKISEEEWALACLHIALKYASYENQKSELRRLALKRAANIVTNLTS